MIFKGASLKQLKHCFLEVEIQTLNFPRDLLRKFLKYPTIFLKLYQFW